jgi:Domain of unknown function (DUF4394)
MSRTRLLRTSAALASVLALSTVAAQASHRDNDRDRGWSKKGPDRMLVATTDSNQLITFNAKDRRIRKLVSIKGLPAGEKLVGIDFQPASGALYGVGTNEIVYRISERTGIAIAEGPAFTPALNGQSFGVDFNPAVNRIRVVSDAEQNLALDPDAGSAAMNANLNPAGEMIVGAAYENSQFSATPPAATTLHVVGAANDRLYTQNPPAAGTLTMPRNLRVPGAGRLDVGANVGFDIEGASGLGYLTDADPGRGTTLYTVDVPTGKAKSLGRIGGRSLTLTGLAVVQDLGS